MKRSIFFMITAGLGVLFGGMMLLSPDGVAQGFGMSPSPAIALLFRSSGGLIVASGLLNFMVRNDGDSATLKAVLIFNIVCHSLSIINDLGASWQGTVEMSKVIPGLLVHAFVAVGSLMYAIRMKRTN